MVDCVVDVVCLVLLVLFGKGLDCGLVIGCLVVL